MREIHTPVDPKETQANKSRFPQALVNLRRVMSALIMANKEEVDLVDSFGEVRKVDWDILHAMTAGIERMHDDLVSAGEKDFANKVYSKQ